MDRTDTKNPFIALWTQKGHILCTGHWEITFRGQAIDLPVDRRASHMNSWGIFSFIYEDDPDFAEGLNEEEWIVDNIDWLSELFEDYSIALNRENLCFFYQAINREDWRCGSCGGCI